MMKLQEEKIWEITIETKTQTHIHGGLRSSGMQGLMIRDGRFIIPGSLIKGKWRDALRSIQGEKCVNGAGNSSCGCLSCRIFGESGFAPSIIRISDCISNDTVDEIASGIRTHVAIDRHLRISKHGALVFIETIPEGTIFKGKVRIATGKLPAMDITKLKAAATGVIKSIGSGASRGLGRVDVSLEVVD
ncbi:MAG: hypothetical protein GX045_11185 [Clostridiaceae bacterium]|nr:hypothetical protein [Clostridiaceae bacterium]